MDEHLRSIRKLMTMLDAHERADPVRTVRSVRVDGVETTVPFAPYQLPPPMTAAELEAFEREENLRLPVEVRRAVTELGDGGGTFFDSTREMLAEARKASEWAENLAGPVLLLDESWDAGANHWTWLVLSGEDANAVYHVDDEEDGGPDLVTRSFLSWFEQRAAREWRWRRQRKVGQRGRPDDSALWPVDALLLEVLQEKPGALDRLQRAVHQRPLAVWEYVMLLGDCRLGPRPQAAVVLGEAALARFADGTVPHDALHEEEVRHLLGQAYAYLGDPRAAAHFARARELRAGIR